MENDQMCYNTAAYSAWVSITAIPESTIWSIQGNSKGESSVEAILPSYMEGE